MSSAAAPNDDAGPGAPRAVVAGHGDFAAGVVSAVAQITGRDDLFVTLSNRGLAPEDIERELRAQLAATGARVVFTDLPAGSCTVAARRVMREQPDLVLVTGANLAALLDFAFHADGPPTDAAQQAVDRGRAALAVAGAPRVG